MPSCEILAIRYELLQLVPEELWLDLVSLKLLDLPYPTPASLVNSIFTYLLLLTNFGFFSCGGTEPYRQFNNLYNWSDNILKFHLLYRPNTL